MNKVLNDFTLLEIESILKSNRIERNTRKLIYGLKKTKEVYYLIKKSIPIIANLSIGMAIQGVINKSIKDILDSEIDESPTPKEQGDDK